MSTPKGAYAILGYPALDGSENAHVNLATIFKGQSELKNLKKSCVSKLFLCFLNFDYKTLFLININFELETWVRDKGIKKNIKKKNNKNC